ncbi:cytochrome P450 [Flagelloscypha sp. PMI_526]|nr:cytochrome P450 [Flagelloscypha sp. PMI_526]
MLLGTLSVLLLLSVAISVLRSWKLAKRLPPGPQGLPLLGNLFQVPRKDAHKVYHGWARTRYGPIFHLKVFSRHLVVLNGLDTITDLFERRSSATASRPRCVMIGELVGQEDTLLLFHKNTEKLRDCRQILHGWLNARALKPVWPEFEESARSLTAAILMDPKDVSTHIRHATGSLILKLTYAIETSPNADPYIIKADKLVRITAKGLEQGRWLVDFFPILKWIPSRFPGASFKRWAAAAREESQSLASDTYNHAIKAFTQGITSWTGMQYAADAKSGRNRHPDALICAARSLYGAGIDTTVSTIRLFVLLMLHYPEVQSKAQMEIDYLVGPSRLPNLTDWEHVTYIRNLIAEILRLNPVGPFAVHSCDEDIEFKGYHIPAGSFLMANMRSITMDETVFKDPDVCDPDRYLRGEPDVSKWMFGFGRRACPGKDYASAAIAIDIMHLLWAFEITPEQGCDYQLPPVDFDVTHISTPKAFGCTIKPRSNQRMQTLGLPFLA